MVVGRSSESALLHRLWGEARSGPVAVVVSGEPGIGKTALVRSFAEQVVRVGADVLVTGCVPLAGEVAPLLPFTGARASRHGRFSAVEPGGGGAAELRTRLLAVAAAAPPAAPAVVVVEDLHWADPSTRELLDRLARSEGEEHRLLLVVTTRPATGPGHDVVAEWTAIGAEHLLVGPLAPAEIRRLVEERTPGAPARTVDKVVRRSGGNPLFAEHLLLGDQQARLAALADLLRHRVVALEPRARRFAGMLAVAGGSCSEQLLRAAWPWSGRSLDAVTEQVVDAALCFHHAGLDRVEFTHALLVDAVRAQLTAEEYTDLHRAWADALERLTGSVERLPASARSAAHAQLARHCLQAGEPARSVRHWIAAAEAASACGAHPEASRQWEAAARAIAAVPGPRDGPDAADLYARAAESASDGHDLAEACRLVEAALERLDEAREPARAGRLLERLGTYRWNADYRAPGDVSDPARRALALLPADAVADRARAHGLLGTWGVWSRDPDCRRHIDAALAAARTAGVTDVEIRARSVRGIIRFVSGEQQEGRADLRAAVDAADRVGDPGLLMHALNNLSFALAEDGAWTDSLRHLERAVAAGDADARRGVFHFATHANLVDCYVACGR